MENLPALPNPRGRRQAQHVKLPFAAEMIINADTGQLIGFMLTSENPEAAQALDRLMNGDYSGMQYCQPVTFRPAQYTGNDDKGQVWLQREDQPPAQTTTELVRRDDRNTNVNVHIFNTPGYFMDR